MSCVPMPSPRSPLPDGNRQLGRLVVDVAVAVILRGEEAARARTDHLAVRLGDDREVAGPPPAFVVARELGMRDRELVRWDLALWIPGDSFVERPLHVLEIGTGRRAQLDHRKCSQLASSYGRPSSRSSTPSPSSQRPIATNGPESTTAASSS